MTVFHWDGTGRNGMAYQLQTSAGIWAPGPGRLKHQSTLEADALYNRVLYASPSWLTWLTLILLDQPHCANTPIPPGRDAGTERLIRRCYGPAASSVAHHFA